MKCPAGAGQDVVQSPAGRAAGQGRCSPQGHCRQGRPLTLPPACSLCHHPTMNRRYTDIERARALAAVAANGGDIPLTARQLGLPENTLRQWNDGTRHPEASGLAEQVKVPLADTFECLARQLLDMVKAKLESLPADKA